MDPPYDKGLERQVLEVLKDASCIDENTRLVVEASLSTEFDYLEEYGFLKEKVKRYKTNQHVFIRKAPK